MQPISDLRGALAQLHAAQAETRIDAVREMLRQAGVKDVPTGYEMAWTTGGTTQRDYGATLDRLQQSYDAHLQNQRYVQTWGEGWQSVRIGRTQMTVPQFEQQVLQVQQQAANDAYARGVTLIATATGQLPLRNNDYALTLGLYVDDQVRTGLRDFGRLNGLPDSSASNVFAVNRQLREQGLVGIPDLRLGRNLFSDVTLGRKDGTTEQLQRWNQMRPNDTVIVRPDKLGGSYVVPRATILPPKVPVRGGS
jgi:hypothetical protein